MTTYFWIHFQTQWTPSSWRTTWFYLLISFSRLLSDVLTTPQVYRTNPEAADELVRISNELQVILDLLFPSVEHSKASIAGFMCNIDNTSEMVRKSKLQSERDTDFEFDGLSADMESDSGINERICKRSSDDAEIRVAEGLGGLSKIAAMPRKFEKAGLPDSLMVSSTTAEADVARSKSLRPYFKLSRLPIRTKIPQPKQPETPPSTKELSEQPKQRFR